MGELDGLYCREADERLLLGNGEVRLAFSQATGAWLGLWPEGAGEPILGQAEGAPPIRLVVGGHTVFPVGRGGRSAFLAGHEVLQRWEVRGSDYRTTSSGGQLAITLACGAWEATTVYELARAGCMVTRTFRIAYVGDGEALLRYVELIVPGIALGPAEDCRFEAPGLPITAHYPLNDLPEGVLPGIDDASIPDRAPAVAGVASSAEDRCLMTWIHSETEPARLLVERTGDALTLTHRSMVADRFRQGHSIGFGHQCVTLTRGSWREAMQGFQRSYHRVGWQVPDDIPDWARNLKAYELHVGPKSFRHGRTYHPYQRLQDVTASLDHIAGLGFNAVQLMPLFPFPGYSVYDYHDIDAQYGDRTELEQMVRRAHDLGLRVILDVVIHGVIDKTGISHQSHWSSQLLPYAPDRHHYLEGHPEWFSLDEYGQLAMSSTYAFNYGHPGWQRFVVDALKMYVQELDVDGFRIDAPAWNTFPNWDPQWTKEHRASEMRLAAVELFALAERELKAVKADCIIYSEGVGPLWARASDCCYNYDEQWVLSALAPVVTERGYAHHGVRVGGSGLCSGRQLAEWLEQRELAYPAGTIKVHHVDSHDTHEAGGLGQFRKEAFGLEPTRALFALLSWIHGGIQNYIGAEEGSEDFYRRVLQFRDALPCLQRGTCDYTIIGCTSPAVIAPLRSLNGRHVIPIVHFSDTSATVELQIPARALGLDGIGKLFIRDLWNDSSWAVEDSSLGAVPLDLSPYGVRLLSIDPA